MEEIFRVVFQSPEGYEAAKKTIITETTAAGFSTPLFSFDDSTYSVICNHSHFYLRTLLRDTKISQALGLEHDSYTYFTNQSRDQSDFTVIPNTEGYKKRRQEALDFYATHRPAPQQPLGITNINDITSREFITELLKRSKSCFGEGHEDRAPKAALINNMPAFKAAGAVLLLEHLFINQQPALDHYISGSDRLHIAPEVGLYLENSDRKYRNLGNHGLVGILMAAHKYGVPVVGIEDPFALDAGAFGALAPLPNTRIETEPLVFNGYDRILLMNHNAVKIAEHLEKEGIKSVTLCGAAHVRDNAEAPLGKKIPGLASSFGIPELYIEDKPLSFTERLMPQDPRCLYLNPDMPEKPRSIEEVALRR